jgi:hypothetical protein
MPRTLPDDRPAIDRWRWAHPAVLDGGVSVVAHTAVAAGAL